jgi:hypothetical protein
VLWIILKLNLVGYYADRHYRNVRKAENYVLLAKIDTNLLVKLR